MRKNKNLGKAAAAAVVLGALASASPAFASAGENVQSVVRSGTGSISANAYSWLKYDNKNVAIVNGKDFYSHPTYTEYDRVKNHGLRLDNGKEGSTKYSGSSVKNYVQKVTACINVKGSPDTCGPADRPNDGR